MIMAAVCRWLQVVLLLDVYMSLCVHVFFDIHV